MPRLGVGALVLTLLTLLFFTPGRGLAAIFQVFDPADLMPGPFTIEDFEDDLFEPGATYSATSGVRRLSASAASGGVTPSGLFGLSTNSAPDPITITFDAPNVIDPLSLKFGPRQGNIWGSPQVRDVDGDGDDDLMVRFLTQQTGIACGDTSVSLIGRTFDLESISGSDTINTFNCPRVRKRH